MPVVGNSISTLIPKKVLGAKSGLFLGTVALQSETTAWLARVTTAGGTVTSTRQGWVDAFIVKAKSYSTLWAKINNGTSRLSLQYGDQLSAALIPLIRGGGSNADVGIGLTSGDYTTTTGITGDGGSKGVDTQITALQAGMGQNDGAVMIGFCGAAGGGNQAQWSNGGFSEEMYYQGDNNPNIMYGGASSGFDQRCPSTKGLIGTSTVSGQMMAYRRGTQELSSPGTTNRAPNTNNFFILQRNDGNLRTNNSCCGYYLGAGLTNVEVSQLNSCFTSFWAAASIPAEDAKWQISGYGDSIMHGNGATSFRGFMWLWQTNDTLRECINFGNPGEPTTAIAPRVIAAAGGGSSVVLIMAGTNNYSPPTQAMADHLAMANALIAAGRRFVFLTPLPFNDTGNYAGTQIHADMVTLCNYILTNWPNNSLDTRSYFISQYNPGIPQDVSDHSNDVPPTSLTSTSPHPNDAGYAVLMPFIKAGIEAKGW